MKCLKCSSKAKLLESLKLVGRFKKRVYECPLAHRFSIVEVPESAVDHRSLAQFARGKVINNLAAVRKAAVWRQPELSSMVLSKKLGISDARVRQIRAEAPRLLSI